MLKLEKLSKTGDVNLIIRDKARLLNHSLLIAFFCALGIHLLFLLLFTISPFSFGKNLTLFPPVEVQSDAGVNLTQIVAAIEKQRSIPTGLPTLAKPIPSLPANPSLSAVEPMELFQELKEDPMHFHALETTIYEHAFASQKRLLPVLQMKVCGPLGNCQVIKDGTEGVTLEPLPENNPHRAIFSVLVNMKNGKVLWYDPQQLTGSAKMDILAVSILKEMKFHGENTHDILPGEIEMHFNAGKLL